MRDERGAAALEFALVSLPLIGFLIFSLQMAMIFFFDQALQTLTTEAARLLKVGSAQQQGMTQSQFATAVCALAPPAFQCSRIMIDVESSSNFASTNTTMLTPTYDVHGNVTTAWQYNPGGPSSIVIVRVMYNWPIAGGPLAAPLLNQPNQMHLLVGTAVMKNEPY